MSTVRDEAIACSKRLGDSTFEIWSQAELEGYVEAAYLDFVTKTKALWDSAHVPDRHSPAYTTDIFARLGVASRRTWAPWVPSPGGTARSNRGASSTVELGMISYPTPFLGDGRQFSTQDGIYSLITSPADVKSCTDAPPAQSVLPEDVGNVERATWDGRRLTAITPQEANKGDPQWEQYSGEPFAYALVQKGSTKILKRDRGPSSPADMRPYSDEAGVLRGGLTIPTATTVTINTAQRINLSPFADFNQTTLPGTPKGIISTMFPYPGFVPTVYTILSSPPVYGWPGLTEHATTPVVGTFGIPRRVPGAWYTNGPWGIAKRFNVGLRNTRIDYVKRPNVKQRGHFELQDWDVRYLRFRALSEALNRDGPGQNKKLAKHYRERYDIGVAMMAQRHASIREATNFVMGGEDAGPSNWPATARLPGNYGWER